MPRYYCVINQFNEYWIEIMNTPLLTCAATCQTEHPESQSNVCFVFVTYSWMEMCSMCAQRNYVFDMVASIWINDEYFRRSSKWTFASRTDFNLFFFPNLIGEHHETQPNEQKISIQQQQIYLKVPIERKWLILLIAFASRVERSIKPDMICQLIAPAPAPQEIAQLNSRPFSD